MDSLEGSANRSVKWTRIVVWIFSTGRAALRKRGFDLKMNEHSRKSLLYQTTVQHFYSTS